MNKFTMLPLEMLGDTRLQSLDIVVYAALDSFADSAGSAWPGLQAIAERGRVSSATVKRSIRRLQSAGYILKEQRHVTGKKEFDTTLYKLSFRAGEAGSATAEVESAGAEAGSLEYGGLAPSVHEVGSESSSNYNHRTITKELKSVENSSTLSLPAAFPEASLPLPLRAGSGEEAPHSEEAAQKPEMGRLEIESLFNELWERYPRKDYRGEAKKVFLRQFSPAPGAPRETITRRLAALNEKFLALEEKAEGLFARGEESFIPCLHKWLAKEDFTDV
jgi:DNA-binding Lrp family transcriptional regulator